MQLFDHLAKKQFKRAPDGSVIFFPAGMLSKGYVLPADFDLNQFLRMVRLPWMVLGFVFILGVLPLPEIFTEAWDWFSLAMIIVIAALSIRIFLKVRHYPISSIRLDWRDSI